jgi:tyrocidine synthetase-3
MRGLVTGSISFDIHLITIFSALIDGGSVVLPGHFSTIDVEAIIHLIQQMSIDFMMCVPSLYEMILKQKKPMLSLKTVSLGGESLPRHIPVLHREYAPNASLLNEYGPSEWAMGTTIAKIVDPETKMTQPITIGKPHPTAQIHLLDSHYCPVPPGEKGEIFIAGDGLAIGYLNRPSLTAEKFPYLILDGKRIRTYQTGDFARMLPNGNLEYLGRSDHQVKIRGFRIELGEVEHTMTAFPQIQEAVVVAKEDGKGFLKIVAYFVADSKIEETKIKEFLKERLPSAAIPSMYIQLEHFEKNPNGKIDRASLPEPIAFDASPGFRVRNGTAQSQLENELIAIWQSILGIHTIGINDNFFEIGGDSLSVVNLQTALETELKLQVSVVDLFQFPTIQQIANHLNQKISNEPIDVNSYKKKQAFLKFKTKAKR